MFLRCRFLAVKSEGPYLREMMGLGAVGRASAAPFARGSLWPSLGQVHSCGNRNKATIARQ